MPFVFNRKVTQGDMNLCIFKKSYVTFEGLLYLDLLLLRREVVGGVD